MPSAMTVSIHAAAATATIGGQRRRFLPLAIDLDFPDLCVAFGLYRFVVTGPRFFSFGAAGIRGTVVDGPDKASVNFPYESETGLPIRRLLPLDSFVSGGGYELPTGRMRL